MDRKEQIRICYLYVIFRYLASITTPTPFGFMIWKIDAAISSVRHCCTRKR